MQLSSPNSLWKAKIVLFKYSIINNSFQEFYLNQIDFLTDFEFNQFYQELKAENLDLLFFYYFKSIPEKKVLFNNVLMQNYKVEKGIQYLYFLEIKTLIEKLSEPFLVLKGILMPDLLQIDLYKRSCDIDILVQKKSYSKVIKELETLSYTKTPGYYAYGEQSLVNELKKIHLDIHYDLSVSGGLMQIANLKSKELFLNSSIKYLDELPVNTLDKEYAFVHLCFHFAINHNFTGFIQFFELLKFIDVQSELDWNKIIRISKRLNLHIITYTICQLKLKISGDPFIEKKWSTIISSKEKAQIDKLILQHNLLENIILNKKTEFNTDLNKLIINDYQKKFKYFVGQTIFMLKGMPMHWTKKFKSLQAN